MLNFGKNIKNETIESLLNGYKKRVDNNFFTFQENYVIGTYYNISDKYSVVSEIEQVHGYHGDSSPIKYDKILNMPLCGLSDVDINIERGDFGMESNSIEGDLFLFPNTITPTADDRFTINHLPNMLFKVTSSTTLKLDNGMNMWRISYKIDNSSIDNTNIESLVVGTYHAILDNIGTDNRVVIKDEVFNNIKRLEEIISKIKLEYLSTFYESIVDTIILKDNGKNIYDPYLLEFIIENRLLDDENINVILYHHLTKPKDFIINYNKSIFKYIERKRISAFVTNNVHLKLIEDIMSSFINDPNDYYKVEYCNDNSSLNPKFNIFDSEVELSFRCSRNDNLIISILKILNDTKALSTYEIESFEYVEIFNNKYNFYVIPLLLYSLKLYLLKLMS